MNDLQMAIDGLEGHTICLCKDGRIITSDKRGIAPMADFISEQRDLRGYSAADLIVGKAAALLFVKARIKAVFAQTVSTGGLETLRRHGVPCSYGELTEFIINRQGSDICPMERAVQDVNDPDEAYARICAQMSELKKAR